ncbi:hypothetical protein [Flavihumibacter sp. CACIAM 22H1]|uniref:hypothetical protein n=1 Tax=Flavihumibacter sp. CACIAM 22H1 TaxID=1812911 RepID=UPI0007A88A74|nr:hypothetical protein [Flavihumibacter sp. CACIAM 22H1]KYP14407.1 MAG: hypothetical protein A1D16_01795 [Flavihumibacter sp. CACIAM 22H1]
MIQKIQLRNLLLLAVVVATSSCSVMRDTDKLEYAYAEGVNYRKLVIAIPNGFQSESHHRDENGVLTRIFHYRDGSEFFIACKDKELNPIIAVERTATSVNELKKSVGEEGSGKHSDGTNWRRTVRDCFIIGYDFVEPARAKIFDEAIHSSKVRRG